ncbi:hypothetical protein G9P44_003292 [Scheffersomyces stipitis]|nr:hypothetical protein G9P44_003292 [Scheffersomyces stipitis]
MAMVLLSGTNSYVSSENFSNHSQTNYYHSHPMPSSGSLSRRSGTSRDSLLTPFDRPPVSPEVEHNPFGIVFNTPVAPKPFIQNRTEESIFASRPTLERASYNQIEEAIMQGKHPAIGFHPTKPVNQTVTVIDQSSLNRNGSIVSRSALKHRSSIRSRNKMVRKNELPLGYDSDDNGRIKINRSKSVKFKKKSKFMNYLFPVKRRTSLKYSPLKYTSKPLFSEREQLQQFLGNFTSSDLTKDVIPLQMMMFSYKKLLKVSPELKRARQLFELDEHDNFQHFNAYTKKISDPATERSKVTHRHTYSNIDFNEIVYQKYKNHVFSKKLATVPKLEEEFPSDIHLLNKFEIDQINKKLLLEVLLRRTLAAKIGYRLQQSEYVFATTSSSTSTSNTDTTSRFPSSQGENEGKPKESHGKHKKEKDNNKDKSKDQGSDESSSSRESVDTDVLMRRNASLYSEFLPSPQISYSSNIFGDFQFPSQAEGYEPVQDSEYIPSSRLMPLPLKGSSPIGSPESLYVNDFNKAYRNKYKTRNKVDPVENLFSSNFQLMPINRSIVTLSSSGSDKLVTPNPTFRDKNNSSSSKETSSLAKTDNSQHGKRKYTDSTGHTSFFHNKETSSEDSLDKSRQSKPSTNSSLMVPSSVPIVGSSTLATSVAPASILHSPLGQLSSPPSLGYTQISQAYGASYPQTPVSISIIESLNKNGQVTKQSTTSQIVLQTSPEHEVNSLKGSISIAGSNAALSTVSNPSRYATSTKSDRRSPSKSTNSNDSFHYREKSSLSVLSIGADRGFEEKSQSKKVKEAKKEK